MNNSTKKNTKIRNFHKCFISAGTECASCVRCHFKCLIVTGSLNNSQLKRDRCCIIYTDRCCIIYKDNTTRAQGSSKMFKPIQLTSARARIPSQEFQFQSQCFLLFYRNSTWAFALRSNTQIGLTESQENMKNNYQNQSLCDIMCQVKESGFNWNFPSSYNTSRVSKHFIWQW